MKSNSGWIDYRAIIVLTIMILIVLAVLAWERANAQTIHDTTLTFTSAADLNRQLREIEGCNTTYAMTKALMDSLEKKYYPTIVDFYNPAIIVCRRIAWVAVMPYIPDGYVSPTDTVEPILLTAAVGIREEAE